MVIMCIEYNLKVRLNQKQIGAPAAPYHTGTFYAQIVQISTWWGDES